jgi:hypothetical protein
MRASVAATERTAHHRESHIVLDRIRANVRTACYMGDTRARTKQLAKLSRDLARGWPEADGMRDAAERLERAIGEVLHRGGSIADLAHEVR